MYTNTLTLANSVEIPQLGLGTWFIDDGDVADAVKAAVKLDYRHFSTGIWQRARRRGRNQNLRYSV